jgi:tetratricopeptide (TPR) repeat protein
MLGVTHVLEGSVRKAGTRVRVTAQLIAAVDGSHVWSERYDRELADVFAIQDEIAQAIATALQTRLTSTAPAAGRHKPLLSAYEAFLKARHHLQRWTPESLVKGREQLERAVQLDPEFAAAHTELGWCFFALVTENQLLPADAAALMRSHAQRALALDPSLPDPHAVLGLVAVLDYNWAKAAPHFQLACAREPIAPLVRYFHSTFFLSPLGRTREVEEEMERLIADDPLNLFWRAALGLHLFGSGRIAEGEAALRHVLDLDANFWLAQAWLVNSV